VDFLVRKISGTAAPVKNGVPSDALIESIADTGMTITSPTAGPEAPVYKLGLQVTPIGGAGAPYSVEIKEAIPRLFIPMILPGARLGVFIDPADPNHVSPDFSRVGAGAGQSAAPAGVSMTPAGPGGFGMNFDASGNPNMADVSAVATGVRSGQVNTIKGSADELLATGTHGTAVITTAMPLGKTVKDINPNADPSRLNDPVWLFTVEATVPGDPPFPAVFGHRVPIAKVGYMAPGVKLAVSVNMANKNQEMAIDWEKSPLA
jgi:hypothetical protein